MNKPVACELISWNHCYNLSRKLALKIIHADYRPHLIVVIARGGYIPGRILADYLGVMDLSSIRIEHYRGSQKEAQALIKDPLSTGIRANRILLVDDVSDTGDTFRLAIQHLKQHTAAEEIKTAALHHKIVSNFVPDFYAKKILKWRWLTYPWATVEDLTVFIRSMEPPIPKTVEELSRRLERDHGISVKRRTLEAVLATVNHGIWKANSDIVNL